MSNVCKEDSRKNAGKGCDVYGKDRMKVALIVKELLNRFEPSLTWFLDNGTLLGAYRSGSFIAHDDDFDIMALIDKTDHLLRIDTIYQMLKSNLPEPLECRIIDTYTDT